MAAGDIRKVEAENRRLKAELAETHDILRALRRGEVDALVSSESDAVYAVQLIALAVDKAENYLDALALLIRRLCEATHSDYCEAWAVTPNRRSLQSVPAWCGAADAIRLHEAAAGAASDPPAALLEVFRSRKPQWLAIEDLQGERALHMRNVGLQSGLVLPLVVDERVLAVMTLWTLERRERDEAIVATGRRILDEAGPFVQRKLEQDARLDLLQSLRGVVRDRSRRVAELSSDLDWKTKERDDAERRARNNQQARLNSEKALHQETALLQSVLDGMMDGVIMTDAAGKVTRFNAAAERLLGKAPGGVPLEHWPKFYGLYRTQNGAPLPAPEMPLAQAVRGERTDRVEIFVSNDACGGRTLEVSASPVHEAENSAPYGAVMLLHDVTEQRRTESMRRIGMITERDALVRQVHHNVKNSLAGIIALVQQYAHEHPEMKALIQDVECQLSTIATVHGMEAQGGRGILLGKLVESLSDNVHALYGASMKMGQDDDKVWQLRLLESESVPLALALNELLVNACKHGNRGSLEFSAAREGQELVIKITNNASQDARLPGGNGGGGNGSGLGIELVRSLLPHDKARLDFQRSGVRVEAILRLGPGVFEAFA